MSVIHVSCILSCFLFLDNSYKNVEKMLSDLNLSHLLEKFQENLIRVKTRVSLSRYSLFLVIVVFFL